MPAPARKPRKPTISKPTGLDFKSVAELKSNEEDTYKTKKLKKYLPKKRVLLLPGTVLGENEEKKKE
jgi:hypothetical protein